MNTAHNAENILDLYSALHKNVDFVTKVSGVTTSLPVAVVDKKIYPEVYTDVSELKGVGNEFLKKLRKANIRLTNDFLYANLDDIAQETGIQKFLLLRWRSMAELNLIKGVGPYYAAMLVKIGVQSIEDLVETNTRAIALKINRCLRLRRSHSRLKVNAKMIESWKTHGKTILNTLQKNEI